MTSYAVWFSEAGTSGPRLTEALAKVIPKAKISKYENIDRPSRDFDLRTKPGWERAKHLAKKRGVLFSHYSPNLTAQRLLHRTAALHGEDHRRTEQMSKTDVFGDELKITKRCIMLCAMRLGITSPWTSVGPTRRGNWRSSKNLRNNRVCTW